MAPRTAPEGLAKAKMNSSMSTVNVILAASLVAASLLAACCCPPQGETALAAAGTTELLVKFRPGTAEERITQVAAQLGLETLPSPLKGYRLLRAANPQAAAEALARLRALPEVEAAQPNYRYRPAR